MIADAVGRVVVFKSFSLNPKDFNNEIKTIFSGDEKLLLNYKSCKIIYDSPFFTLIPNRLFNESDKELYLDKTTRTLQNDVLLNDTISFNRSQLVYAWDNDVLSVLKNYFPSSQMFHTTTSLLHGWHKQAEVNEGKKVYLDVDSQHFTISFFDEKELVFVNRFKYITGGDFLYYTLMTYDRFELKPETDPCIISGNIMLDSEIYKKLYSYIRHIQFMPNLPYYDFPMDFKELKQHRYFDLYSLKLCES